MTNSSETEEKNWIDELPELPDLPKEGKRQAIFISKRGEQQDESDRRSDTENDE